MSPDQVVRAWKDADYGECLDAAGAAALPAHPIGPIDIADSALDLAGASVQRTEYLETLGCCQGLTQYTMCDVTAGPVGPFCTLYCITIVLTSSSICGSR